MWCQQTRPSWHFDNFKFIPSSQDSSESKLHSSSTALDGLKYLTEFRWSHHLSTATSMAKGGTAKFPPGCERAQCVSLTFIGQKNINNNKNQQKSTTTSTKAWKDVIAPGQFLVFGRSLSDYIRVPQQLSDFDRTKLTILAERIRKQFFDTVIAKNLVFFPKIMKNDVFNQHVSNPFWLLRLIMVGLHHLEKLDDVLSEVGYIRIPCPFVDGLKRPQTPWTARNPSKPALK